MPRGGYRKGSGRKKDPNSKISRTIGLTRDQWAYLDLWFPGGTAADQVTSLLDRAVKFWPAGPNRFRSPASDVIDESGCTLGRFFQAGL